MLSKVIGKTRGALVLAPLFVAPLFHAFSHQARLARRSYWSPAATTGQRYIYTGSYDGRVHVYGE